MTDKLEKYLDKKVAYTKLETGTLMVTEHKGDVTVRYGFGDATYLVVVRAAPER